MDSLQMYETLPPGRLFIKCTVPSMISMAVTSLYTVADGIFVGRYIGSEALAAINLVMPFIMIAFALSDMIAVGSSVQTAVRLGEKKPEEASRVFSFSSLMIVLISLIVGVLSFALAEPLVRLLGADEAVTRLAVAYMRVYALFSPLIMIFFALDNYLRICGLVRYSMVMNVAISLLNIGLDALFIVGLGWGVGAAALASCLSLTVGTFSGLLPFLSGRLPLKPARGRLPLKLVANIFANGSSEFFSNISSSVMMTLMNAVLLHIAGTMAVAAFSIVMYVDSIVKSLLFGMADAMQPSLSYNFGAKNQKRLRALEGRVLFAGAFISISAMLAMLFGGHVLIAVFLEGNQPDLLAMSTHAMRLYSLSYLVSWFGVVISSFFTALDRPAFSLAVAFGQTLAYPAICLFVFPRFLGLDGVWLSSLFAGLMTTATAGVLFLPALRGGGAAGLGRANKT